MNRLTDERMDKIIKTKFKDDEQISDKANAVFENFKFKLQNGMIDKGEEFKESKENKDIREHSVVKETNEVKKENYNKTDTGKVVYVDFYSKLNKVLSVAAVTLIVVLVGGTVFYLNNDNRNNGNNSNNIINSTQSISVNKPYMVKNDKLEIKKQDIIKSVENSYLKAYIVDKHEIGVEFTSIYWNEIDGEFKSTECFKVDGIDEDIKDIFLGNIGELGGRPYIFLLTENGTIKYIDVYQFVDNALYYNANNLNELKNVVGFEQMSRKFSYSDQDYFYVNAIRNDGVRKEIEVNMINRWDDTETVKFNQLNDKFIKAYNNETFEFDGKGKLEVDGIEYIHADGENEYVYYKKNTEFYRVKLRDRSEQLLATGVFGLNTGYPGGKIAVFLTTGEYKVFILDDNIVFLDSDDKNVRNVSDANIYEEENKKLGESNLEYYRCPSGYYGLRKLQDLNCVYYVCEDKLIKYNISQNNYMVMALNVEDVSFNNVGELIAKLKDNYKIYINDDNIVYKEKNVSLANIKEEYEDSCLHVYLKEDGSLNVRILKDGINKLNLNGKTEFKENIIYNITLNGGNSYNSEYKTANANIAIIGKVGPKQKLSIVYYDSYNQIVIIDVNETIMNNDFGNASATIMFDIFDCKKFEILNCNKKENEDKVQDYKTVFAVIEKDGEIENIEVVGRE